MRIQNANTATRRLYVEELMADEYPDGIEFDPDGVARVRREVGEALVASDDYPGITAVDGETSGDPVAESESDGHDTSNSESE